MNKWKTPLNANRMNKSDEWTDELWFYGASTSWIFLSKNTTSVLCLRLRVSHQSLLLLVFIVIGSAVMSFYMNSVLKAARGHRASGSSFWASFVPDCYHHRRTQQIHSHANEWSQMTWIGDTQLQLKEKKTNRLCKTKALKRRCTHAAPRRGTRQDRPTLQSDIWASFLCWGLLTPHSFTSLTLNAARYKTTDRIQ